MTREEKQALAGSYVLRLLDEAERAAFSQQALADPELADMADRLAERMSALDTSARPAAFASDLWQRIERQLDAPKARPAKAANTVLPVARSVSPLYRTWMPLAASVVVALGVGYMLGVVSQPGEEPTVIAILLSEADASPAVIVEAFADDSVRLVPLESFAAPAGQVLQLWTLPDADTGPVSLGTLSQTANLRLEGPNLPLPHDGQLYEITLEPAPGSPTGRPTGPILVKGFARAPCRMIANRQHCAGSH